MLRINGTEYNIIYLDSNALNGIAKNTKKFDKNFFMSYLVGEKKYMFATSPFNLYEISQTSGASKESLIKTFDLIPLALFNTIPQLIEFEKEKIYFHEKMIMFATGPKPLYNIQISTIFEMLESNNFVKTLEKMNENYNKEIENIINNRILCNWKLNYKEKMENSINETMEIYNQTINLDELEQYKSVCIYAYIKNQFKYSAKKVIKRNTIIDCINVSILPYVEEYITERTVGSWLKEAQTRFEFIKDKNIVILSELEDK